MYISKKHYVYLAGNISGDPRTYEWRENFENEIKKRGWDKLVVLNPCSTRFNRIVKSSSNKREDFFKSAQRRKIGVLPLKDYQMIKICSIIVANFKLFTSEKPIIGTIYEMAWARILMIPVIAIVDESTPLGKLYSRHPFQNYHISERVNNEIEAIDLIEEFFMFQDL